MLRVVTPKWVQRHNLAFASLSDAPEGVFEEIRSRLSRFQSKDPEVSIVIIAHNEEGELLKALSSLSSSNLKRPTELIVINNGSSDRTQEVIDRCGAVSYSEPTLGIGWARQKGLSAAKGRIILNADADSIYPPNWSNQMAAALEDKSVSTVYTRYSFVPSKRRSRPFLNVHEMFAESLFTLRRKHADPVNVMGFSFGFRKEDALAVGGFDVHARGRWEDGLMVLALTELGGIKLLKNNDTRVWTSDRRLISDGGYMKAFMRRAYKHLGYMPDYLNIK